MADILKSQSEYRQIEEILEKRRANSRRSLEARRRHVIETIPEYESLEYKIAAVGLASNRALLSGEKTLPEAQQELENDIGALIKKRDALLFQSGFAEDYLALKPECALCGDTGYIAGERGQSERCSCYKQMLYDSLEAASNILSAGAAASFEMFDETLFSDRADVKKYKQAASPRENICRIRDSSKRFVRAFNEGIYENLYFFGQPGTGKTFMAASIANELMRSGTPVLYLSAPTLSDIFTEHRMRSLRDENYRDTLYRQVLSCKLLIVDDLGLEPFTDSRFSEFVTLLNERLVPGRCSTIISTNKELNELKIYYDERVFSRIVGHFNIIRFYGDDIRHKRPGRLRANKEG